ncbi:hypothetical protein HYQ46_003792 [Verticillium longisporum]|nr:hypothetical protein HYQ46_003792 [Verticillium longisporum]
MPSVTRQGGSTLPTQHLYRTQSDFKAKAIHIKGKLPPLRWRKYLVQCSRFRRLRLAPFLLPTYTCLLPAVVCSS